MYLIDTYDVIVVGAGHAGCEAALAAAKLGMKTLLATISLDNVAMMPCNPAIGGPGKSHLVREIDALGGIMGIAADATAIQMRMLNRGKGPAVHALRAQSDKNAYHRWMKSRVENTDNLDLKQLMVTDILEDGGRVTGIVTELGEIYRARAVILATGTYLDSKIIIGETIYSGGPAACGPALPSRTTSENTASSSSGSRQARRPAWTCGRSIPSGCGSKKETRITIPSPSWTKTRTEISGAAGSPIRTRPPTPSFGRIFRERPCSQENSRRGRAVLPLHRGQDRPLR